MSRADRAWAEIVRLRAEVARLRASLASVHCRLKFGDRIDSHTVSSVIAECEHAFPMLIYLRKVNHE